MTQKTRTQLQAQIGGYDPEEFQTDMTDSAWLKDEIATQAEAEAGLVTDKMMTPLRVAQAIAALGTIVDYNPQTGTSYTLQATDAGKIVECLNASAITVTIPADATVDFPIGQLIDVRQTGAGAVTIAGAGGVTVNSQDGNLQIAAQWVTVTLEKRAANTWLVTGALA